MSYAEAVSNILGVEVNQPFRIKGIPDCWYRINQYCQTEWDCGLNQETWYVDRVVLMQVLDGTLEVGIPRKMTIEEIEKELGYSVDICG